MLPAVLALLILQAAAPVAPKFVVPNLRDLKIEVRETHGLMQPTTTMWYFKGPRQRVEHFFGPSKTPITANILQCDQKTEIMLRESLKTYRSTSIAYAEGPVERKYPQLHRIPTPVGPDVTVTIDSTDTGERRQVAGHESQHIKTTITTEPSKGAMTKPGKVEVDAWYLDLPGIGCRDNPAIENIPPGMVWFILGGGSGTRDHKIIKQIGTAPHGFVIEETATQKEGRNSLVHKIELVQISEKPLDDSLFGPPADFSETTPGHELIPVRRAP